MIIFLKSKKPCQKRQGFVSVFLFIIGIELGKTPY